MGERGILGSCIVYTLICSHNSIPRVGKRRGVLITLFCVAAVSAISVFALEYLLKNKIRNEVSELIGEHSFVIETFDDFDNEMFIKAIKSKRFVHTHKTHPLEKRSLRIVGHREVVVLQVAQDSKNPKLYWVYYPKYRYSNINELGKVRIQN